MLRPSALAAAVVAATLPLAAAVAARAADEPTIATIMGRDFVGTSPESPRFADDGRTIYYEKRRPGTDITDLWQVDVASGRAAIVADRERGTVDPAEVVWSRDRRLKTFVRDGDLFYRDLARGVLRQVTRTPEEESAPLPLLDGRVAFRRGDAFYAFDPATGTTSTLAELLLADDPDAKQPEGFLVDQQQRYFQVLRERKARKEAAKAVDDARRLADPTRLPKPWYLGKGKEIQDAALAPDGAHLALFLGPERDASEDAEQGADGGKPDKLAAYVNDSGYVEIRRVRPKVGTGHPETPQLVLLDLRAHERHDVDLAGLPGVTEDPLADLRAAAKSAAAKAKGGSDAAGTAKEKAKEEAKEEAKPRIVTFDAIRWSEDGARFAVQFFSYDNKDRWLAAVEASAAKLVPLERLHDPAWIGWRFNDCGWMRDGRTLWYQSEESGWGQLWLRPLAGAKRALTQGRFELDRPLLSRDGKSFVVVANRELPGIVEVYRVDAGTGAMTRLTELGGTVDSVALSPDEKQILFLGSKIDAPPEVFALAARGGAAKKLTDTVSKEYRALAWVKPEIVAIDSTHGAGRIWTRVFTPPGWSADRKYPAVAFVHGAGYLQSVTYGWPDYYREMMFATLLARRGYVVFDMDYRASSGYGRDWRTAIYRQMGWPEVEDYADGIDWMVAHKGVDRGRIGVYGGSYGGFFTLMALFTRPELFAAGAALRPVSDWAHYNHGYTSNILNTPDVDPEAYRKSSPIEYAEGLRKPLLILHGMVDDNVTFQDSVRLVERLIELGKTDDFDTAFYPVEKHGFVEPSSWTDEYRRIWNLFERTLW